MSFSNVPEPGTPMAMDACEVCILSEPGAKGMGPVQLLFSETGLAGVLTPGSGVITAQ
jgi:hypothetical protein